MRTAAFMLLVPLSLMACSSEVRFADPPGGAGGASAADGATVAATSGIGATTATTVVAVSSAVSVTSTGTGRNDCWMSEPQACSECCVTSESSGYSRFAEIYVGRCACDAGAICASVCDTDADPSLDVCGADGAVNLDALGQNDRCITCFSELQADEACIAPVIGECQADPECALFLACQSACTG